MVLSIEEVIIQFHWLHIKGRMLLILIESWMPVLPLSTCSVDFVSVSYVNLQASVASRPFTTVRANQCWWTTLPVHSFNVKSKKAWHACTEGAKIALEWNLL